MDKVKSSTDLSEKRLVSILMALPDQDFDPTESSTPWKVCRERGWRVIFSTEKGAVAASDHRLLMGPFGARLAQGRKL